MIVSGSDNPENSINIWDTNGGLIKHLNYSSNVTTVCFSSNDSRIASGSDNGEINIWETKSGKNLQTLKAHKKCIN